MCDAIVKLIIALIINPVLKTMKCNDILEVQVLRR